MSPLRQLLVDLAFECIGELIAVRVADELGVRAARAQATPAELMRADVTRHVIAATRGEYYFQQKNRHGADPSFFRIR
jgi:hypothetical protein